MSERSNHSKKWKGGGKGGKWQHQTKTSTIESGDVGVFVTCDMGREKKALNEAIDLFSQALEDPSAQEDEQDTDDEDIEAQIQRELEGLQPNKDKPRQFRGVQLDMPCVTFVRLDPSIEPVQLVHRLCSEAHANPDVKKSRYIQRMHPMTKVHKTLSVDLAEFAKDILKPYFHSGGPPKTYAIRPSVRGNAKLNRDIVIKTVADAVGPEHPVNLKNYDYMILVDIAHNVIGMSVVGSDYDKLRRFNLAEIYNPSPKGGPTTPSTKKPKTQ
ncbi:unnamed protein product [Penicillium salamii]|uniref:THUMP domain-containing protein n=1 Tax=Penicillium salamii TaxID=1612424 RepID=A0A9W4NW53_9EURO|nr:unnamed protein product [Penicillium salamii]CAG8160753.1 unnamed protein product [Penicillium salamii]CAG8162741.1 unnamed protein product [Penicillium salamii]CAG8167757.1 unnamed protein product [Penicillium salamii]CAG8236299.1 unnamed protein product [Penicillium salamii]